MTKENILEWIKNNQSVFTEMAQNIWDNPQIAYEEKYASELQMLTLEQAGFKITREIGGASTAFVAEYGSGNPIIGILGEYDALPGLSQTVSTVHTEVVANGPDMAVDIIY